MSALPAPERRPSGRLRLRSTRLKNNVNRLVAVMESLRTIAGVVGVEGNCGTGGILIDYIDGQAGGERFWDEVQATLVSHAVRGAPRARHAHPGAAAAALP
jgi:hypothetical protein